MQAFLHVAVALGRLVGLAVVEARAVGSMRDREQIVVHRCGIGAVEHRTVGVHDRCDVEGLLVAPLELDGVDARRRKVVQMVDHAKVLRVEHERTAHVLLDGEILARAFLLHQRVAPAARLGAVALVPGAARHRRRQKTASRHRHAHGAVGERLDLQLAGRIGPQAGDVLDAHLPRAHHARGAHVVPAARGGGVGDARLRAHMQGDAGRMLLRQSERAQVAHDERVDARIGERLEVSRQRIDVVGVHERIERHVHRGARIVGEPHGIGDVRQREVLGALAHAEPIARQIDRIRAEAQRGLQLGSAARRREQLHGMQGFGSHAGYGSTDAAGRPARTPRFRHLKIGGLGTQPTPQPTLRTSRARPAACPRW